MEIREQPVGWEPKEEQETVHESGHLPNPGVGRKDFGSPSLFYTLNRIQFTKSKIPCMKGPTKIFPHPRHYA